MNSKLEQKLLQYEKSAPISNDDELIKAIENIIQSEESLPYEQRDFDLIEEGIDTVLSLKGIDIRSLEECTNDINNDYVDRMNNKKTKSAKKSIRLRWIIPIAALLSLLAITVGAHTFGYNLIDMTKEAFMKLKEKTWYTDGKNEFIITSDFKEYSSLSDYLEKEDTSHLLLPYDLPEDYRITRILVSEYGAYQETMVTLAISDEEFEHHLFIDAPSTFELNQNPDMLRTIGNYLVVYSHYDDIYQGEFIYDGNYYQISTSSYENLETIIEHMSER
ncbi:MAG: hypothetical protein HFE78_02605 [Clostridiales bacterium]|nr:hypothetical protein [Clostridiales bacterium]